MIKILLGLIFSFSFVFAQAKVSEGDQQLISKARTLFEKKKFKESIVVYEKISQKSDRWLLALEEKAWAYLQLKQYDKALAQARTLTSPALSALVGTEPFLLQALTQLKICDYVGVFKTIKAYKKQKRAQVEAIQNMAKKGVPKSLLPLLKIWSKDTQNTRKMGSALAKLPQFFYKDKIILSAAEKKHFITMKTRLKQLAIDENNENYRILQKLNLIEVESIQRVHIDTKLAGVQGQKIKKGKYDLVFKDTKEVWLDELDSYQATINRCQKKSGRSM